MKRNGSRVRDRTLSSKSELQDLRESKEAAELWPCVSTHRSPRAKKGIAQIPLMTKGDSIRGAATSSEAALAVFCAGGVSGPSLQSGFRSCMTISLCPFMGILAAVTRRLQPCMLDTVSQRFLCYRSEKSGEPDSRIRSSRTRPWHKCQGYYRYAAHLMNEVFRKGPAAIRGMLIINLVHFVQCLKMCRFPGLVPAQRNVAVSLTLRL